jgi:hypothetical protein
MARMTSTRAERAGWAVVSLRVQWLRKGKRRLTSDVDAKVGDNVNLEAVAVSLRAVELGKRPAAAHDEPDEADGGHLADDDDGPEEAAQPLLGVEQAAQQGQDRELGQAEEEDARAKGQRRPEHDLFGLVGREGGHVAAVAEADGDGREDGGEEAGRHAGDEPPVVLEQAAVDAQAHVQAQADEEGAEGQEGPEDGEDGGPQVLRGPGGVRGRALRGRAHGLEVVEVSGGGHCCRRDWLWL